MSIIVDPAVRYSNKASKKGPISTSDVNGEISSDVRGKARDVCGRLLKFFSEFEFEPSYRFTNTLVHLSKSKRKDYIVNYFELSGNPLIGAMKEKMKSPEFKEIVDDMDGITSDKYVNKRFKLYYGSQGTGKTTRAAKEAEGGVMVCHSGMLPQDLMEDFKFEEGNPSFTPSALQKAMVEGKVIVLDEINLLPFESVRFLQTILDNKEKITYKGQEITIKEGFEVIGTMNLTVNGQVFSLPEPLVDRAVSIEKFTLTADALADAIL